MPKAIEIYVDQFTRELVVDTNHPMRESIFRFGWDDPQAIWEGMNDTVPAIICSRVRLVQQDGTPIMSVEDHTDQAMMDGLCAIAESQRKEIVFNACLAALQDIRSKASEIFGLSREAQQNVQDHSGCKG